jgi:peptidoglycan/xylan/chitin deacetylase (PgdA/CDA1 family)
MKNIHVCFPGGRFKALTFSYDDGNVADRRLVSIFNAHGLKATFHLNSGNLGKPGVVSAEEVPALYAGHEVSCHTVAHPTLARCPPEQVAAQILEDRKSLEALVGYPVRGFSYPNGSYSPRIIGLLPGLGIEYARVVPTTGAFHLPEDFLEWRGTCHHGDGLAARGEEFLSFSKSQYLCLMYVWGHSYEFDRDCNWRVIEDFAEKAGGRDELWYATNIEIVDWMNRWKAMRFSADCSVASNPSAESVWMDVGGDIVEVRGGETRRL